MKLGEFNSYEILPLNLTSTPPLQRNYESFKQPHPAYAVVNTLKDSNLHTFASKTTAIPI